MSAGLPIRDWDEDEFPCETQRSILELTAREELLAELGTAMGFRPAPLLLGDRRGRGRRHLRVRIGQQEPQVVPPGAGRRESACVEDLDTVIAVFTDGEESHYLQQLQIMVAAVLARTQG